MAKTKEQKGEIVAKLEDALKNATSTVFLHFKGLSVADETTVRRGLRAEGVKYFVAKKTLIRRALESLGHLPAQAGKLDDIKLDGEVAIAYGLPGQGLPGQGLPGQGGGEDATAAARLVHEAGKKLSEKLVILGGIFEGKLIGQAAMQEIATIPSMETLRAMFAQVINSPRQRFAVVLSKVAETKN